MSILHQWGWKDFFALHLETLNQPAWLPARVIEEHRDSYVLITEKGTCRAALTGKLRHETTHRLDLPAVGDWVMISLINGQDEARIHALLPRQTQFVRKMAGGLTEAQVVAANVHTVLLLMALNQDFNLRRLERYLTVAWESGAQPVVVLSKADLCDDPAAKAAAVAAIALDVPIHIVSVWHQTGLDALDTYLGAGNTIALLGASGVGKSTLTNHWLAEAVQSTQESRDGDDRGRHTTTSRKLLLLRQGGLLIDTPGMRELHLWDAHQGVGELFEDVVDLSQQCFFRNCQHQLEPDCAVQAAIQQGTLDVGRFTHFQKLQRELKHVERKQDMALQQAEKKKWKQIHQAQKRHYQEKYR